MIRLSFWRKLSPEMKAILVATWDQQVEAARLDAAEAQERAKEEILRHEVEIVVPSKQELTTQRQYLIQHQQAFIR